MRKGLAEVTTSEGALDKRRGREVRLADVATDLPARLLYSIPPAVLRLRPTWPPRRALPSSIPRIQRAAKVHSDVRKRQLISSPQSKPKFGRARAEDWGVLLPGAAYVLPVLHCDERPERVKHTHRIPSAVRGWRQLATESEMHELPAELCRARLSAQRASSSRPEECRARQRAATRRKNIRKVTGHASQSRGSRESSQEIRGGGQVERDQVLSPLGRP